MDKKDFLQNFVSQRIRQLRRKKGLSQENLSEKAGLGLKYINQAENQRTNLSLQTLTKIIEAFDMTTEDFFDFSLSLDSKDSQDSLNLKRLTMKIKQLPQEKQEIFMSIFEDILDHLE
ncbi:helix-turn-helix domain-containing protein [Streptococcus pneumoniae]|nr:helix-turn-helix domain-containing protein [Streptococcus pneumoniae]